MYAVGSGTISQKRESWVIFNISISQRLLDQSSNQRKSSRCRFNSFLLLVNIWDFPCLVSLDHWRWYGAEIEQFLNCIVGLGIHQTSSLQCRRLFCPDRVEETGSAVAKANFGLFFRLLFFPVYLHQSWIVVVPTKSMILSYILGHATLNCLMRPPTRTDYNFMRKSAVSSRSN